MRKKVYMTMAALAFSLMLAACGSDSESSKASVKNESSAQVQIKTGESSSAESSAGSSAESPAESSSAESSSATSSSEEQPEIVDVGGKPGEKSESGESGEDSAEKESSSEKESSAESSSGQDDPSAPVASQGSFSAEDMSVTLNGNKLACGDDFLPYVDKMGIKAKIEEGQACLEGGFDTNYYYDNALTVYTIAKDGKQLIYDIYITGSGFPDNKGITAGKTTREAVRAAYGEPSEELPGADQYVTGKKMLSFEYSDDIVCGISFSDASVN